MLAVRHGANAPTSADWGAAAAWLAISEFLPARNLGEFYAVAAVFGLAYGGVMPLYAVLVRDYRDNLPKYL